MKSRGRRAFRPASASAIGVNGLEERQLLSLSGTTVEIADMVRTPAMTGQVIAPQGDTGAASSLGVSTTSTGNPAYAVGTGGSSSGTQIQQSATPAGPRRSEFGTVGILSGVIPAHAVAADPATSSDGGTLVLSRTLPTRPEAPLMFGSTGESVDSGDTADQSEEYEVSIACAPQPSMVVPPGDIGWVTGAGVGADNATEAATSASPADPPAPSLAAPGGIGLVGGRSTRLAKDNPMSVGALTTRTLLAMDGSAIGQGAAAPVAVWATAGTDVLAEVTRSDGEAEAFENRAVEEPVASPRCADLLTEFVPIGRATLEAAIDRFLAPFDHLGAELSEWPSPTSLMPTATVVATAALASEVMRRRARGARTAGEDDQDDFCRFPSHPSTWSCRGS